MPLFQKFKKAFKNRFAFNVYNFYTVNLDGYTSEPVYSIKKPGYSIYRGNDYMQFKAYMPASIGEIWSNLINELKYTPYLIIDKDNNPANYIFYYTATKIWLDETGNYLLTDPKKEVMLFAGRTLTDHLKLGLSEYGKRHLFYDLHKAGFQRVYLMARKNNPVSNHVNIKMGFALTHRYFVLRIYRKKIYLKIRLRAYA